MKGLYRDFLEVMQSYVVAKEGLCGGCTGAENRLKKGSGGGGGLKKGLTDAATHLGDLPHERVHAPDRGAALGGLGGRGGHHWLPLLVVHLFDAWGGCG